MSLCLRQECIALRQRVAELEVKLAIAEGKNRAAAGLLGDLGMLATRANTMVDVLLDDHPVHERPTMPEMGVTAGDTEPPPANGCEGGDEPAIGDGVSSLLESP